MRCDLHVHTNRSGMCTVPLMSGICRECYNDPLELYQLLKRRGMDLVTVTDHDSIDAGAALQHFPDFFLSEEVTCTTPSGTQLHMGVYGIDERQHVQLACLRHDLPALIAYLSEQKLFFSINHILSSLTGPRTGADFAMFERHFPGLETRNGQIPPRCNRAAHLLAERWGKAPVGGSDAHTMAALGKTFTEVGGARNAGEFLVGLSQARGRVHGEHGAYGKLTRAVWQIGFELMREHPWTVALAPLMLAVPFVTIGNLARELAFESKWSPRLIPAGKVWDRAVKAAQPAA